MKPEKKIQERTAETKEDVKKFDPNLNPMINFLSARMTRNEIEGVLRERQGYIRGRKL